MRTPTPESGNLLIYILIGIVLIGMLTVALRDNGALDTSIDKEKNAAMAQQIIKYNSDVAAGVQALLQNGASEADIRFANPNNVTAYGDITATPQYQVFSPQGGKVSWQTIPPDAIQAGLPYPGEINYGGDRDFTQAGSARPELYMDVFPLTDNVCQAVNTQIGYTNATIPVINCPGDGNGIFTGTFSATASAMDMSAFSPLPALQACVKCSNVSNANIYFGVLMPR